MTANAVASGDLILRDISVLAGVLALGCWGALMLTVVLYHPWLDLWICCKYLVLVRKWSDLPSVT